MMQRPLLFRQEAIDFQRHNREWGQVALLQPLSIKVTTWFITDRHLAVIIPFTFLWTVFTKGNRRGLPYPDIRHIEGFCASIGYD